MFFYYGCPHLKLMLDSAKLLHFPCPPLSQLISNCTVDFDVIATIPHIYYS